MRKLSVVLFGLAACGGSSDTPSDAPLVKLLDASIDARPDAPPLPPPDAPPVYDFSCLGMPNPTQANATLAFSGQTSEVTVQGMTPTTTPKNGVSVTLLKTSDDSQLAAPVTSATAGGMDGIFSVSLSTGGMPVDAYLKATNAGDLPTLMFPSQPIAKDFGNIPVQLLSQNLVSLLSVVGVTQSQANGIVVVLATDCAGTPIPDVADADLHIQQSGAEVSTQRFSGSQLGQQGGGIYFAFDVPPNATSVWVVSQGHTFPAHTVKIQPMTVTLTQTRPGPLP